MCDLHQALTYTKCEKFIQSLNIDKFRKYKERLEYVFNSDSCGEGLVAFFFVLHTHTLGGVCIVSFREHVDLNVDKHFVRQ